MIPPVLWKEESNFEKRKKHIEDLIKSFQGYREKYGGFEKTIAQLQQALADHVNKIGRKK